ncbi:G2/mitotic-specific cyclin (Clb3), putative [Talaromyces stipitatus ATCC 10500]|uniref:G2/mitotic-specific cyclin (Clb3), putative n=1 Tax=Talaromyces stipitatus (strain ATCC 10500 / CBS 375.48 / QM 6759 / NRRL 1006) TaxID=441959 RepID=B8MPZ8_TALSN|nr:G2/mitotic-specific cyclin (Clb3), putative [Talaromyces stipitatus ATCC 10500]EED12888.1 G2/mitotic-specific cyclin (Clb3), putative [Talaromyces stipitatus ATCC 10500]
MDARPQRIRVRGDENAPVGALPTKTIHQRNKSTPALSAALQNGGLRNAAKRTAFGDISNIRASKDDSHVAGKNITLAKPGVSAQDRKVHALSQPAQRSASVMGIKTILNTTSNINVKQVLGDSHNNTATTRKLLTKRSTVASKKQQLSVVSEVKPSVNEQPVSRVDHSRLLLAKPFAGLADRNVNETEKNYFHPGTEITSDDTIEQPASEDNDSVNAGVGTVEIVEKESVHQVKLKDKEEDSEESVKEEIASVEISAEARKLDHHAPRGSLDLIHVHSGHGAVASEPEEYWDDDEDDNEEDDGYVTARSYRSRSENTTGGATTVLFPKYNTKARREIAMAKQLVEASRTTDDIEDEMWDTSMVAEYGDEIFEYMREMEIRMLPNAHYMDNQAEIQWSMRSVLIDWLVQVHHRFSLLPETLFLSVNYIDRFLSCKIVSLGKLQLVGATAIFIAAKYEEINCPSVHEIVYMVDKGYSADEILKAERFMLSMLQFELGWPGPMSFLRRISKADDYDLDTRTLAKYFLEVTIMDERFVGSPPSYTAAGAHCLARLMLHKGDWSHAHVYYSNYTYAQLYPLLLIILECCENPSKHHNAIYEKYADRRFKRSSVFVEAEIAKGFRLPDSYKGNDPFA